MRSSANEGMRSKELACSTSSRRGKESWREARGRGERGGVKGVTIEDVFARLERRRGGGRL